jgi:hypothetical protein
MAIKQAREKFHQNFQVGYKAHPLGYKGVNSVISTLAQLKARVRAKARARMLTKSHVST